MLPATPDPIRTALNRVTFGARDLDAQLATNMGWSTWVETQLTPPKGDDSDLAMQLVLQKMRIAYGASDPANTRGVWDAVSEDRPLNYLNADIPTLWSLGRNGGVSVPNQERTRIFQELAAATWIRNTHSRYQLREFMVDFWHNHFNVGKNENVLSTALLPVYDRDVIRANALGNFRAMLEANATSASMLVYLDNFVSASTTPNENYAREIMELHTLGGEAYLGVGSSTASTAPNVLHDGFTDQDVIQASRALSGWTVKYGQRTTVNGANVNFPDTGEFAFNPLQHNRNVGSILGINVASAAVDMSQGRALLDIIANHPATAKFITTKLAKRMFGDAPPQSVIDRATAAWKANASAPDQIARVVRAMLLDGNEIMTAPRVKVRRPYERIIALFRTTDMVVSAGAFMSNTLDSLNDFLFAWPAPNGRPDANDYWLATGASLRTWNLLMQIPTLPQIYTTLADQVPASTSRSASAVVDYWVGRMVGHQLSAAATTALVTDQAGASGVPAMTRTNSATRAEQAHRRLVSLIAANEEFSLR